MATDTKIKTTPARREYKRNWMRNFRAQKKQANDLGSNPGIGDGGGTDYLLKYPESQRAFMKSRVDLLERQLYDVKHPELQYQRNISYTPEAIPVSQEVTQEFSAKIDELERMSGPVRPRQAKANELEKERERIGKQLTHVDHQLFGKRIVAVRDKLRELDRRAEYLERMIVLWSSGGVLRRAREAEIEQDRIKGTTQRNSKDPDEKRRGIGLLNGCDKNQGEMEVTLGQLKAELKQLRG